MLWKPVIQVIVYYLHSAFTYIKSVNNQCIMVKCVFSNKCSIRQEAAVF